MTNPDEPSSAARAEKHPHWRIEGIAYDAIDHSRVAGDELLFYLLASASFVESGSDTYTRNLVTHFADQPEMGQWLLAHWEPEELQHGRALGRYVQAVWPQFPWQVAYDNFMAEYARLCTVEALLAGALEMAARCVVEMGTSTYYQALRMLAERADEPVLTGLLERIRADEVGHYKRFLAYFKTLKASQPVSRWRVARALGARLKELRESDSDVALRHVWAYAHEKGAELFPNGVQPFDVLRQNLFEQVSQCLPIEQAVRMTLKPLMLPHRVESRLQTPLAWLGRRAMMA
ncbi:MAG: ferritin-like domain-containing protein [Burkholderiaceae bacterium]|nr:ferritin-like domain-containing protein [Burkholderiaceae bacterium]